jgi:hypothetical protein
VAPEVRRAVERQLVQVGAPDEWLRGVREFVPIVETERAQLYGEDLPVGLRLIVDE